MVDGDVIIGTEVDDSGFKEGIDNLDKDSKLDKVVSNITKKFTSIGKGTKGIFKNFGGSIKKIGTQVVKLGAIALQTMAKVLVGAVGFGVAFTAALGAVGLIIAGLLIVGNALKKVGDEHKELKTQFQYIIFALQTALAPAIEWLADKLFKILQFLIKMVTYAMALVNILAGKNVFEKADAKAFADYMAKSNKNAKGVAKSAKDARKQLAGFDEMNVLQDNVSGSGGGTAKDDMDTFQPIDVEEAEKNIQLTVEKYKGMWTELEETNKIEGAKLIMEQGGTWAALKAGTFLSFGGIVDIISGKIMEIKGWFDIFWGIVTFDGEKIAKGFGEVKDGIIKQVKGTIEFLIGVPLTIYGILKGIYDTIWNWFKETKIGKWLDEKIYTPVKEKIEKIKTVIRLTKEWIGGVFKVIKGYITGNKKDVEEGSQQIIKAMNEFATKFKGPINNVIGFVNKMIESLNKFKIKISKTTADLLNELGFKNIKEGENQVFNIKPIPTLAKGGIINMPGKGTYVGGAIAGEAGREGVIPLTDNQQMELLGEAIGRYITINATILNKMNGRTLSREMTTVRGDNSFANNW